MPTRLTSMTAASAETSIASAMPASFRAKVMVRLWPVVTMTSLFAVAKPLMVTLSLYVPEATFRKRKSPFGPDWVVRVPELLAAVMVAPGNTAPDASVTVP